MNEEALARTIATGEAWYWSRSRQELWHKGATSGQIQKVIEIRTDCDQDTIWIKVGQMQIETDRLLIRPWTDRDLAPFAAFNADPAVRRYYYPALLTRTESDTVVSACMDHLDQHGFAFLATERKEDGALIGGTGLSWTDIVPGGPAIEIGWILGKPFWRQGYARETGHAWLNHAWSIGVDEVIGYTSAIHLPSRSQMEALGMIHDAAADFEDPTVPIGNELRAHVLYRMRKPV
eukprot:s1_g2842.t1